MLNFVRRVNDSTVQNRQASTEQTDKRQFHMERQLCCVFSRTCYGISVGGSESRLHQWPRHHSSTHCDQITPLQAASQLVSIRCAIICIEKSPFSIDLRQAW